MKPILIYALIDPRTNDIRYVGKTNQPISYRISAHMQEKSKCHRVNWLNELKKEGLKPIAHILEKIEGKWPWQESERFWISYLRFHGCNLVNNTSGGDGVPDLPKETREKMRKVWLGRKHKASTIEKLKAQRAGFRHTEETKKKMSAIHTGRKITWTDKISEANRKLKEEDIKIIKQRLKKGELGCNLAKEYGVHRTTMSKIKMGTYIKKY